MKHIILSILLLLATPAYAVTLQPGQFLSSIDAAQIDTIILKYDRDENGIQVLTTVVVKVFLYKAGTVVAQQAIELPITQFSAQSVTNLTNFGQVILDKYLQAKGLVKSCQINSRLMNKLVPG